MGKLRDRFLIWLASRGSRRNIPRLHKGNNELYLVRYHLFRWSLFIHGRRTREWGFLRPGGWEVAENSGYKRLTGILFPRFK